MKILYVVSRAIQINSSSSIRNLATVNGLVELGHEVTIISSMYDKNHVSYDEKLVPEKAEKIYLSVGGIQKIASVGRKFKKLNFFRVKVNAFLHLFNVYDNLQGIVKAIDQIEITDDMYDIVISSSDPKSSHLFVYELFRQKKLDKTPWVQIWGDPFAADITNSSLIYRWRAKREEEKLLEQATYVAYVSKLTCEEQKRRYPNSAKKMIYNLPAYVKESGEDDRKIGNPMNVVYCGNFSSKARNIVPFYNAMRKSEYDVSICGNGDVKIENTKNIKYRERCSFEEVNRVEQAADVIVYLCNKSGTQIPGKIYQYVGTCKYILFILDGDVQEVKALFEGYERFVFCNNDEADILCKLSEIQEGKHINTRFILEDFSARNRAQSLLSKIGMCNENKK